MCCSEFKVERGEGGGGVKEVGGEQVSRRGA